MRLVEPSELVATFGEDLAVKIMQALGGQRLTIPRPDKYVRDAAIYAAYKRVGRPGGYTSSSAFYVGTARDYRLTQLTVRRIVENMREVEKLSRSA